MKKSKVKQTLEKYGPCVSSELAQRIKDDHPSLSSDAIRQMISRDKTLKRLPYIRFSHNRRFIYTQDSFGSHYFWSRLEKSLRECRSAYSYAIQSIIGYGGFVRRKDFGIICGSPVKQLNHLSYENVLSNLISSKLVKLVSVDGVGDCIVINYNDYNIERIKEKASHQIAFEKPIIEMVKSWIKNIGLVSFNQVRTKYDGHDNPTIGSFEWCIGAPSYSQPLASYVDGELLPGFLACDFILDFDENVVSLDMAGCTVRKMELTILSRKNQRFMFVVVARKFSNEAFFYLRSKGVIALTLANAFGSKIDNSVTSFSNMISGLIPIGRNVDEVVSIIDNFESISGENGNLRGYIFELFTASYVSEFFGVGNVSVNKIYKWAGEEAEADVVLERKGEIIIIECKNKNILSSDDVSDWVRKRIPRINSFYKANNYDKRRIKHFLWVTGDILPEDLARLKKFKDSNKKQDVDFLFAGYLKGFLKSSPEAYDVYHKAVLAKK